MSILLITLILALSITATASPIFIKVGETRELPIGSDQEVNATFYFDQAEVYKNNTLAFNHSWFYTPNASAIGYHNLTTVIENENGSSTTQIEVFVGTMFAVKSETSGNINAITQSILAEPNSYHELSTFVENSIGIYRPTGEIPMMQFTGSRSFFNLTTVTETGITNTNPIPMDNGTKYLLPFNTTNKNGTFVIQLAKPYAETPEGKKINVTVFSGLVKISPLPDINADFNVTIIDLTILNQNWGKNGTAMCPQFFGRCDIIKDNIVNTKDKLALQAVYGTKIPTI